MKENDIPSATVEHRRSIRRFAPIGLSELSTLLWMSAGSWSANPEDPEQEEEEPAPQPQPHSTEPPPSQPTPPGPDDDDDQDQEERPPTEPA